MPYNWSNPYNSAVPYDVGNPQIAAITGIATSEAFSSLSVTLGTVLLAVTGIVSSQAFSAPVVSSPSHLTVNGILSSEAFSTLSVQAPFVVNVTGIASVSSVSTVTTSSLIAPNPRFVRGTFNDITGTSTTNSVTISNQVGNANIVCVGHASSSSLVSLIDTNLNTYSLIAGPITNPSWAYTLAIYMAMPIQGGVNMITAAFSPSSVFTELIVAEYYGISGVDTWVGAFGQTSSPNSGNLTTTNPLDMLISYGGNSQNPGLLFAGSNFKLEILSNETTGLEDRIVTPGTYAGTWTPVTAFWISIAVALGAPSLAQTPPSEMSRVL
jgi:hypothetical protein